MGRLARGGKLSIRVPKTKIHLNGAWQPGKKTLTGRAEGYKGRYSDSQSTSHDPSIQDSDYTHLLSPETRKRLEGRR